MVKGLYAAYTGMINEQNRLDVITNNLANVDTNGYKKEGATSQAFDTVLAYKIKDASATSKLPNRIGNMNLGVKIGENYTDYSQGAYKVTDNTFDLALSGKGFFSVEFTNKAGETSTKYTRDGAFSVTPSGYLVTKDGDYVLNNNGRRITIDPTQPVVVDTRGNISQNDVYVATIGITDFEDYNYLEHYGENYYQPVEGAKKTEGEYSINQGYIETSNVQIVQEMVEMISIQRQYESNQKIITTTDDTLEIVSNQLGKL